MDMVSTTGVEVMTEVVTEASVGEAAVPRFVGQHDFIVGKPISHG